VQKNRIKGVLIMLVAALIANNLYLCKRQEYAKHKRYQVNIPSGWPLMTMG
jgi:hypothetical protein